MNKKLLLQVYHQVGLQKFYLFFLLSFCCHVVKAQNTTGDILLSGLVVNEKGLPVENATISVIGIGGNGTFTNKEGRFSLRASSTKDSISISFIGYATQHLAIRDSREFSITLLLKNSDLDDVVVVAYGQKQRKIETLGAQASLNVNDLKQPVANISTVLSGRISGLVGIQRSGEPGRDGADLWIRGVITKGNNTPLILVDGVERPFGNLDPNDIESVTILKDASSTAVYGVRGANGVMLINTKKGRKGRTDIGLDFYSGITNFTRLPNTADGVTYLQMANEASVTRGGSPIYSDDIIKKTASQEDPYLYPNVNWLDELFNKFGHNRKANLSVRGGNEKSTFYVSAGYYDETGLFKVDGLQKYNSTIKFSKINISSAVSIKATRSTTVDLNIKGWISNGNYPGTATSDIFYMALKTYPTLYPKMYPDNKEPFISTGGGLNSAYALLVNRGYSTTYENQIMSDLSIKQDLGSILKGLSARALYSFDATNSNSLSRLKSPSTYYATQRDIAGNLVYTIVSPGTDYLNFSRSNGGNRQFYLEAAINYNNSFGKHKVGAMLLYNQSDKLSATASDLINSIPARSLGSVGRLTYSYDDRYLAEGTFGYNGSEAFTPKNRFGFFPSAAIGWVVSNEKFYGNMDNIFQLLKLRASYGLVGSSNLLNARRFGYVGTVANSGSYAYGQDRGNLITGIDINDYPVDVSWETEKDLNIGLELKFLHNAASLQVDVFSRRRENIFLGRGVVPDFLGVRNNLTGNLGITKAKGIDITGNYDKRIGKVDFSLQGTFTYNKNEMVEDDSPAKAYPWLETRGQSVYTRFGYVAEGFYTQEEINDPKVPRTAGVVQAGDIKFKDLNGDGVIDANNDVQPIGKDQVPQIVYGFGTSVGYKGFSLNAFFQGTGSVDFYFANDFMPFRNGSAKGSLYSNITDRWTIDNPRQDAFYPRLSYGADINQNYSVTNSHFVMNGSFLRLKTLDFGYTIPKGHFSKYGVQKMRVYFVGYNLLTFSSFKFWDPELGGGAGTRYPNIRTYSAGLSVTF